MHICPCNIEDPLNPYPPSTGVYRVYEPRCEKTCPRARVSTNRAVQPQNIARGLKFRIYEVEGLSV